MATLRAQLPTHTTMITDFISRPRLRMLRPRARHSTTKKAAMLVALTAATAPSRTSSRWVPSDAYGPPPCCTINAPKPAASTHWATLNAFFTKGPRRISELISSAAATTATTSTPG